MKIDSELYRKMPKELQDLFELSHKPDCPVRMLDEQSGKLTSGAMKKSYKYTNTGYSLGKPTGSTKQIHEANSGGASRFFYCAKASKAEREQGLKDYLPCIKCGRLNTTFHLDDKGNKIKCSRNDHPTLKSLKLMEYLCKLTKTPTGGIVLDCFAGSGTTGVACVNTGREFILIEEDIKYCKIARRRIQYVQEQHIF